MNDKPFDILADTYEAWFKNHPAIFQSEVLALREVIPSDLRGAVIGIGSGLFASEMESKCFRLAAIHQTLSNKDTNKVELPKTGYEEGRFFVIKANKLSLL